MKPINTKMKFTTDPLVSDDLEIVPKKYVDNLWVENEVPAGLVNGSNATFTSAHNFVPGSEEIFINGLKQKLNTHYVTTGNTTIIFSDSPVTGDELSINYKKLS